MNPVRCPKSFLFFSALALLALPPSLWARDPSELFVYGETPEARALEGPPPMTFLNGGLTVDVEERLRWEDRQNDYTFNSNHASVTNGNWFLNRFRLGIMLRASRWVKIYLQGQSAVELQSKRNKIPGTNGSEGDDQANFRQAYVEISNFDESPFGLKIGRQVITLGSQRLVGENDWANTSRSFDAVRGTYKGAGFTLDAFASSPVVNSKSRFDQSDLFNGNNDHRDLVFSGLYLSTQQRFGLIDYYALQCDRANGNTGTLEGLLKSAAPKGDSKDRSDFITLGSRIVGEPQKLHGWEFQTEGAYQTGRVRGLDLSAFAVTSGVGYNFDAPWKPRLYVEYNYASGDNDHKSNEIGTFQNLFASNHAYYDIMDAFSWKNMQNAMIELAVQPVKSVKARVEYNAFWIASNQDAWYRSNDITQVRPLNAAAMHAHAYEGCELAFIVTWTASRHLEFEGGYSYFFAGQYLADTGGGSDAQFGYLMSKLKF
jgi:hypothetical protein